MSGIVKRPEITKGIVPIIRSQNSSCVMVFYRFNDPFISKVLTFNASNDKPFSEQISGSQTNLANKERMVVRQDILKCQCSNDKSGVSGTFSATFKRGKQLHGNVNSTKNVPYVFSINPGDWVMIYMKKSAQITDTDLLSTRPESGLKYVGIVESTKVNEVVDPNGGVSYDIQISGRSFGKIFDTNVIFSPILNGNKAVETVLGGELIQNIQMFSKSNKAISPDSYVKAAASFFMKGKGSSQSQTNQAWFVPIEMARLFKDPDKFKGAGRSISDLLNYTRVGLHQYSQGKFTGVQALPGAGYFLAIPSSGTVWSILQFFANLATNEMFTELVLDSKGSLQLGLIHRQLPFSNKRVHSTNVFTRSNTSADAAGSKTYLVDLPSLKINSTDVLRKNLGKSDHERINYVSVVPRFFERDVTVLYTAAVNSASIQRYGVKSFQTQTSYVLKEGQESAQNFVKQSVSLLVDWFFLGHELFAGSMVIDGVNKFVAVGDNVYIQDLKQLYHIQGYTHSYEVDGNTGRTSFFTTLEVTRGQHWDGRQAKFLAETDAPNLDPIQLASSFIQTSNQDGSK